MAERIYPKGLRTFPPREGSPDFAKGTLIITLKELVQFAKENPHLLTEYNGQKQLKCQILEGENGPYLVVDTWKPDKDKAKATKPEPAKESDSDLPF